MQSTQANDFQWGVQSTHNLTVNPTSECPIARTQFIKFDDRNWVEVGWFEDGWADSVDKCSNSENPHVAVIANVDNYWKCKQNTDRLYDGDYNSFKVVNLDHDFDFHYYWSELANPTIFLGFFTVEHGHGYPIAQAERQTDDDNLRAEYQGAKSLGGGGEWHGYPDWYLFEKPDTSPWNDCGVGSTFLTVKLSC